MVVNGTEDEARRLRTDGVRGTAATLAAAMRRPEGMLVGSRCHTRADLEQAASLGIDYAVVGPVTVTPTHPDAAHLGWNGSERLIEETRVPVYALGGLSSTDLDVARERGAHGIAMRRGAW